MQLPKPEPFDPIVRRELKWLHKRSILEAGEIICELQDVVIDSSPAALVLTDKRLLVVHTSLFRRKTTVIAIPLERVEHVAAGGTKLVGGFWRSHGSLTLRSRDEAGVNSTLELDRIPGGQERAEEIARSISRQRAFVSGPTQEM